MREAGTVLVAVGVLGFLAALFLMPTSIATDALGGEVVNLALQQRQLLVAIGGAALFVGGVILYAAGTLADLAPAQAQEPAELDADQVATMERFGIVRDPSGYLHRGFVYARLADAVAAAERNAR